MKAVALRHLLSVAAIGAVLAGAPAVADANGLGAHGVRSASPRAWTPAGAAPRTASVPTTLPAHTFAPYVQLWLPQRLPALAKASGAKYLTLAFLESAGAHSCTLVWNTETRFSDPLGRQIAADARSLRALGGDVVPSFGGYGADQQGREIADSCANVTTIANAYQSVITTYGAKRLDMDVEDASLTRTAGIDRRNRALKLLQDRLAAQDRTVQVQYTLPTTPGGLAASGLNVLKSAIRIGTRVDVVNIMVFDWYDGATTDMGGAAIRAAAGLRKQLGALYPRKTDAQLWGMIGLTIMPGIDDNADKSEVTTVAHAQRVLAYASSKHIAHLAMWALQRDNGGCPGIAGTDSCSGIVQSTWAFSKALIPFTRR